MIVALPLVVDLPRPRCHHHHLCPSRPSRMGWLSFRRGRGGCRCGRVCEPSCLRVCHRWMLLILSWPTHRICVVVVQSLALGRIRWRWSLLGGSIGPPPCCLDPLPPSRARVACLPPARLAPYSSFSCSRCLSSASSSSLSSRPPPPSRIACPSSSSGPFSSSSSSRPSLLPDPSFT